MCCHTARRIRRRFPRTSCAWMPTCIRIVRTLPCPWPSRCVMRKTPTPSSGPLRRGPCPPTSPSWSVLTLIMSRCAPPKAGSPARSSTSASRCCRTTRRNSARTTRSCASSRAPSWLVVATIRSSRTSQVRRPRPKATCPARTATRSSPPTTSTLSKVPVWFTRLPTVKTI